MFRTRFQLSGRGSGRGTLQDKLFDLLWSGSVSEERHIAFMRKCTLRQKSLCFFILVRTEDQIRQLSFTCPLAK